MSTRRAAIIAATVLVAAAATGGTATADDRDNRYCGNIIHEVSPGQNGVEALKAETENDNNLLLENTFHIGDNEVACFVARTTSRLAVGTVVKFATGSNIIRWVKITGLVTGSGSSDMPAEIPAVGGSDTAQGEVFATGGAGLYINTGPGVGSTVTLMPEGVVVPIKCQVHGPAIEGPYGITSLWNLVEYNGVTGFSSDAYMYTGSNGRVATSC